ncbi:uncharacterized protein LOC134263054 [Saccostrea cucullata]|uniref:uncharacterized protein LOC134263054 n=1 Tax=Saccostrea cuccullata TaxID=36930 RepID=UPI002ED06206
MERKTERMESIQGRKSSRKIYRRKKQEREQWMKALITSYMPSLTWRRGRLNTNLIRKRREGGWRTKPNKDEWKVSGSSNYNSIKCRHRWRCRWSQYLWALQLPDRTSSSAGDNESNIPIQEALYHADYFDL